MTKFRKVTLYSLLGAAAILAVTPTLALADPAACYDSVLQSCAAAMDGAAWYERFALGELCTAMLPGCAFR